MKKGGLRSIRLPPDFYQRKPRCPIFRGYFVLVSSTVISFFTLVTP